MLLPASVAVAVAAVAHPDGDRIVSGSARLRPQNDRAHRCRCRSSARTLQRTAATTPSRERRTQISVAIVEQASSISSCSRCRCTQKEIYSEMCACPHKRVRGQIPNRHRHQRAPSKCIKGTLFIHACAVACAVFFFSSSVRDVSGGYGLWSKCFGECEDLYWSRTHNNIIKTRSGGNGVAVRCIIGSEPT